MHCFHVWEGSDSAKIIRCPIINTCHSWQVVPFQDFEQLVNIVRKRIRRRRFLDEPGVIELLSELQNIRLKSALLPSDLVRLITKVRTIARKTNAGDDIRSILKQLKN